MCGLALTLDGVHDVGTLAEDGVAKCACPLRVVGHRVENGGEWEEREDAWIPGEIVGLNGLSEGVTCERCVLLRPRGCIGDLIPKSGGGEDLGEERVGVEGDALDELVELLRRDGRRRGLLLLLRVGGRRRRRWLVGLSLLLVWCGRRRRLADDGGLSQRYCGERQESQSG